MKLDFSRRYLRWQVHLEGF
uniref:Uncharacterized protein n=1 Tax=Arundo donax TaxID=35708 RepID=A0A0A8Y1Y4_ARUDO